MSVLIDTDPALGLPFSDIDDALAIHYAFAAGMPISGLTTCFGNAPLASVTRVAKRLGTRFGIPVYAGAGRPGEVDNEAVDALVAHKGTVLALAPLTNIAAALLRGANWEQLIVLGGTNRRLPNLRPLHTTELNFALDLGAAAIALEATDVLFPMEVCRQVFFTAQDLEILPAWMAEDCQHWMRLAPLLTGRRAFHPWDLLPAIWLTDPQCFTTVQARAMLHTRLGYAGAIRFSEGATEVAIHVDSEGLKRVYRETLGAHSHP